MNIKLASITGYIFQYSRLKRIFTLAKCSTATFATPRLKLGFTLAEMLITLAIIGVVAAIIIPNLLSFTQDIEYRNKFKKIAAAINQAGATIKFQNGGTFNELCILDSGNHTCSGASTDSNSLRNLFAISFSYTKSCNYEANPYECWVRTFSSPQGSELKYLNGYSDDSLFERSGGLILNDGTFLLFEYDNPGCLDNIILSCGSIIVDVNGKKGPNTWGRDVYGLTILQNRIIPFGTSGDDYSSSPLINGCSLGDNAVNNVGYTCAANVLLGIDY